MAWLRSDRHLTVLSLSLLLPIVPVTLSAQAATPLGSTVSVPLKLSLDFKVVDRGAPPATAGGASRGFCLQGEQPLKALVPKQSVALTIADRPSFFFLLPPSSATQAEFLLLGDEDTQVVYQTTFKLPASPGIVQFELPADAPALEIGKRYHWYVTLACDPILGASGNPSAEAWVERIPESVRLTKALEKVEPLRRADLYAEAGLWHETLSTLVELRRQQPHHAKLLSDWKALMTSPAVGLEAIVDAPLTDAVR